MSHTRGLPGQRRRNRNRATALACSGGGAGEPGGPPGPAARLPASAGRQPELRPWLRQLPLRPRGTRVQLHDGRLKQRQDVHWAVFAIDVGGRDLQQCADAVIRLRAEYLHGQGRSGEIHFNFTSGERIDYSRWTEGWRPHVSANRVSWRPDGDKGDSYQSLRAYLQQIFIYAGTHSLGRKMAALAEPATLAAGDVFIEGGFPGHAVIVVDLAINPTTGAKAFMLAQSFMPAQDIHLLRNPLRPELGPWYRLDPSRPLITPEWTFQWPMLRRFKSRRTPLATLPAEHSGCGVWCRPPPPGPQDGEARGEAELAIAGKIRYRFRH